MAALRDVLGGVPMWSTRQGALDAERLHAQQREATLAGERDAALRECAELRATVAGLEARLEAAQADTAFYRAAFCDEFKAKQKDGLLTRPSTLAATRLDMPNQTGPHLTEPYQTLPSLIRPHHAE